jgi:hypothetical protein
MSVFNNIRVYPDHGIRRATLTWAMAPGTPAGLVYVAKSETGTKPWVPLNPNAPVPSASGMFVDDGLVINSGSGEVFYRLMLTAAGQDYFSESIGIYGDLTRKEYGMVRAIIHREFMEMRATNGYPVFHCIPLSSGEVTANYDPDTGEMAGIECDDNPDNGFGTQFVGGFCPPVLTWVRALQMQRGSIKDAESDLGSRETDVTDVRLMAFPRPARGHMIVDPASGRRYLIGDEIKPFYLRGAYPVAYEAQLEFLTQNDVRYKVPMPDLDTKAYRKIKYWSPA